MIDRAQLTKGRPILKALSDLHNLSLMDSVESQKVLQGEGIPTSYLELLVSRTIK